MENKLVGKTIVKAEIRSYFDKEKTDDRPLLVLTMSDDSVFVIEARYGGYTGHSRDEYPVGITVEELKNG